MDVFVIPVGPDRYELYCEQPFSREHASPPAAGIVGRVRQRFEDWLRRAEEWDPSSSVGTGRFARLHDKAMAWVAERVVEQRLLWNLRRETAVTAVHPETLPVTQALAIVHRSLQQDLERHQYWVWVDGVSLRGHVRRLGPLFLLIPGIANLPALYFGFRTVGHWYSRGGARHGLQAVHWIPASRVRPDGVARVSAPAASRASGAVDDIAERLGLAPLRALLRSGQQALVSMLPVRLAL